jgi:hypothetical protein
MEQAPTNKYRPMGAFAYLGYQLLFSLPIIGFIFIIVFALDDSYIARRNYARSFLIMMIIMAVFAAVAIIVLPTALIILEQIGKGAMA